MKLQFVSQRKTDQAATRKDPVDPAAVEKSAEFPDT